MLSGGGARGIAHIGVIEELERRGYEITSLAGTSMGALVATIYASGTLPEFKEWLFGLSKKQIFKLVDFSFKQPGLIKGEKAFHAIKKFVTKENIEDFDIPLCIVAVDILNKKEVVFKKGSVLDALRASVAIPTVFAPLRLGDNVLVDGGVLNNLPVDRVVRKKGDVLLAVDVNAYSTLSKKFSKAGEKSVIDTKAYLKNRSEFNKSFKKLHPVDAKKKLSYFDVLNNTLSLLVGEVSQHHLEKNPPDILVNISREASGLFDFLKAKELVELGRYEAKRVLDKFEK